jgi:hypothetical protein
LEKSAKWSLFTGILLYKVVRISKPYKDVPRTAEPLGTELLCHSCWVSASLVVFLLFHSRGTSNQERQWSLK